MTRKVAILFCSLGLFACTESTESKFNDYCLNEFNQYDVIRNSGKVTQVECSCVYASLSKKMSTSEIEKMISAKKSPVLSQEQLAFVMAASECIKE